ncbi:peptidase M16 [Cohaesibacter celericrescens]|uniref:Peptidase M16 n=2 Tax=Cohaesibacter celericrescens TaxID=2067669 RepID=A0A2N5XVD5_9HYPH|nr:peptidase M16 [Cohaesibacter celericrescens]
MARAQEIQKVVSASGIEAWLVEDHTVPIIAIDFSFAGGVSQDEDGKEGGVTMLTSLMDEGADDLSSEEFLTALEENAIKMKFDAGRDRFFGSLRTLTPNKALAFELLAKAIQSPHFEASSVERMRAQWIASVRRAEKDPNTILARTFREAAYPGHPYSRPSNGTATSLAAVTQADLKHLHKAIFTRDGLTIGIVGAIDAESVKTLLDQVFAPLPAKGDLKPVEDVKIARIGEIHVPFDAPQTSIRFGAPGIDRQDDDFYAAYLVNHILGGGSFSSRLYNEIREKRGLAYGVYSYLTSSDHAALFAGGMATRSENNEQAITLVKQEIARLGKEGPTQEELDATKKYLIGSYPLRFDSSSKISRQLVALQNEGLNIDYFEKRNSYIEAVTLEDTKRVAARLLDPSKLLLVTVGKQMKNASLAPKAPVSEDALAPSKTKPQTN